MTQDTDPAVGEKSSYIQAAFLVGWALGGAVFGRIGDAMGRSRALVLTILVYAGFTGLSALCTEWWHLLICRFLSALGIGGEWAVGAALLSETLPKKWRPWIAAGLQTAVNLGILLACLAGWLLKDANPRWIFVVGVLPAFLTLWIRHAVPETEEWQAAKASQERQPGLMDLFSPAILQTTLRALTICAASLAAHWAFMFWQQKFIRTLPEIAVQGQQGQNAAAVQALTCLMIGSIVGNFIAGWLAKLWGYKRAMIILFSLYGLTMIGAFSQAYSYKTMLVWFVFLGAWAGVFGLFTMCLPPLFPTLLRTTGAGFCFNIGRLVSALGVIFLGKLSSSPQFNLLYAGLLFIPAAALALLLPQPVEDA